MSSVSVFACWRIIVLPHGPFQLGSYAPHNGPGVVKSVSPDAENAPPRASERDSDSPVAGEVPRDFSLPVWTVILGHAAMPSATMPEATVHEDCQKLAKKHKIRAA